jgi:circadian clock protein KaiC
MRFLFSPMTLSGFGTYASRANFGRSCPVIKMRGGNHSKDIREYEITSEGVIILGERLTDYEGLITGIPTRVNRSSKKEEPRHERKAKSKS